MVQEAETGDSGHRKVQVVGETNSTNEEKLGSQLVLRSAELRFLLGICSEKRLLPSRS